MEALVSVIVPVYNAQAYLPECLDSILRQTCHSIEIICVDDGSADRSGEILDGYARKDTRIKVIHKRNEGVVRARKEGLRNASGNLIGFVDSDDWIEPDMYGKLLQIQQETDADVVVSAFYKEYPGSDTIKEYENFEKGFYDGKKLEHFYSNMLSAKEGFFRFGVVPALWNKLYRREKVEQYFLAVDERLENGEDAACLYPSLLNAASIYVTDTAYYHYCQRSFSNTKAEGDNRELFRIRILYESLYRSFQGKSSQYCLMEQLEQFIYYKLLERCIYVYDLEEKECTLRPFGLFSRDTKLMLYGAGNWGKHIFRYLNRKHSSMIAGWADKQYTFYQKENLPVISIEEMKKREYDFILICILDEKTALQVKQELTAQGFTAGKLRWLDRNWIFSNNIKQLLNQGEC